MHVCLLARQQAVGPIAAVLRRRAAGPVAAALRRAPAAVGADSSPSDAVGVAPSWALLLTSRHLGRAAVCFCELQTNVASLPCACGAEMAVCKRL